MKGDTTFSWPSRLAKQYCREPRWERQRRALRSVTGISYTRFSYAMLAQRSVLVVAVVCDSSCPGSVVGTSRSVDVVEEGRLYRPQWGW